MPRSIRSQSSLADSAEPGTLQAIAENMALAVAPLWQATSTPEDFQAFMGRLGWSVEDMPPSIQVLGRQAQDILEALMALDSQEEVSGDEIRKLLGGIINFYEALTSLDRQVLEDIGVTDSSEVFGISVFELLLVDHLSAAFPEFFAILEMLGLITHESIPALDPRPGYLRSRLDYRKIATLLTDPLSLPVQVYGWGEAEFRFPLLASHLARLFTALGVSSALKAVGRDLGRAFQAADPNSLAKSVDLMVAVTLFDVFVKQTQGQTEVGEFKDVGFAILEFPGEKIVDPNLPGENWHPPGFIIRPALSFDIPDIETGIPINERWTFRIILEQGFPEDFGIAVRPDGLLFRLPVPVGGDAELPPGMYGIELVYGPQAPYVLLGQAAKTRLQVKGSTLGLRLESRQNRPLQLRLEARVDGLALVLSPEDFDGFLNKLLGGSETVVTIPLTLGWSNLDGFKFGGTAGFSISIDPHLRVGPVGVDRFDLGIRSDFGEDRSTQLALELGLGLTATLGPVSAAIHGVGLRLQAVFPDQDRFGVDFGFKPPTGVALAVDAAGISGGGGLDLDSVNQRYSGSLGLNFGDIGLAALGLIETRLPDGSDGFSLLISISALFSPPLPLSLGFTLNGVGGLIGVNRAMAVDVLRAGLRQGSLDAVLFPDPVTLAANAVRILSDLEAGFPATEGRFLVGPVVKIGWGSPSLITAELGIFLDLPDPVRIVLLGQLRAALPKKDAALLVINLDVLGIVDFARQELTFQATLYDSRILAFKLAGDSAFLLGWGSDPRFALALGGFHPRFSGLSHPIFVELKRLSVSISSGNGLSLKCEAYQALTPNTVQFGARLDLYASLAGLVAKGYLGFDALFCLSPFSFEVEICGGVHLAYKGLSLLGIDLRLRLCGPTPWSAHGTARIRLLFFSIKVGFSFQWGNDEKVYLPSVNPWEPLEAALSLPTAWGSKLPPGQNMVETLRALEPEQPSSEPVVLLHPLGRLQIRQNVLPLAEELAMIGNAPVISFDWFDIVSVSVGASSMSADDGTLTPIEEFFAAAQFREFTVDEKLSRPSFEKMKAGVMATADHIEVSGIMAHRELEYEPIFIDEDGSSQEWERSGIEWEQAEVAVAAARARILARRAGPAKQYSVGVTPKISVDQERYCIAKAADLTRAQLAGELAQSNAALTRMSADRLLRAQLQLAPEQQGELLIILEYEVEEA